MQTRQSWILIVLATIGAACAHAPHRKPDKDQPLALDAGGKYYNWQAPPRRQRTSSGLGVAQFSGERPFRAYERRTPAGNPVESMESPLRQLLQPVPVADAPLPLPSSPAPGKP